LPGPDGAARLEGFLREFNGKALIDLIAHEGYPGHYVQGRYAAASPSLVRKIFVDGAYAEGWACYGEAMMLEEGFMDRDPGLELQVLKMRLKVIVNAILDIKLHRGMMGEDEVVVLLVDRCFQSEGEAKAKLVRAKGTAVQLSTYYIGFLEMLDLRKDAEAAAGEAFDLAAFHHKVLNAGAPPLRFLRSWSCPEHRSFPRRLIEWTLIPRGTDPLRKEKDDETLRPCFFFRNPLFRAGSRRADEAAGDDFRLRPMGNTFPERILRRIFSGRQVARLRDHPVQPGL
jgi:hypothetical protein